jgi:hypothetical protein
MNPESRISACKKQSEHDQYSARTATMEAQLSSTEVRVSGVVLIEDDAVVVVDFGSCRMRTLVPFTKLTKL